MQQEKSVNSSKVAFRTWTALVDVDVFLRRKIAPSLIYANGKINGFVA